MEIKVDKGPAEVLRALASGNPEQIKEAMDFQRESFRAQFGCYPEELELAEEDDSLLAPPQCRLPEEDVKGSE